MGGDAQRPADPAARGRLAASDRDTVDGARRDNRACGRGRPAVEVSHRRFPNSPIAEECRPASREYCRFSPRSYRFQRSEDAFSFGGARKKPLIETAAQGVSNRTPELPKTLKCSRATRR